MTTARDIIEMDLREAGVIGVGQTPNAIDINDSLTRLNDMLAQWQRKRWLIYHLIDVSIPCTGATSYSIGTGQMIDTPRPDRLEAAFIRQISPGAPNQPDWPLEIVESRERYNDIVLKQLQSFPRFVFYDAGYPYGSVYAWPVPTSLYELHLTLKAQLSGFPTLETVFDLPAEYAEAIRYNLRLRTYAAYPGLDVSPIIPGLAKAALETIKNANAQIPTLKMPDGLVHARPYNIFSDGY